MTKKALILDLDNTIYSVRSIGDELFSDLFNLISSSGEYSGDLEEIKKDIMRKPFQQVAEHYQFNEQLTAKGVSHLKELSYEGKIQAFPDYEEIRKLSVHKYLVTTGFFKLQTSKVKGMKLDQDFDEIHIVDPDVSKKTKRNVFADILKQHQYQPGDVLVVGDDPDSEIQAAESLGIDTVLYDKLNLHPNELSQRRITDFSELPKYL